MFMRVGQHKKKNSDIVAEGHSRITWWCGSTPSNLHYQWAGLKESAGSTEICERPEIVYHLKCVFWSTLKGHLSRCGAWFTGSFGTALFAMKANCRLGQTAAGCWDVIALKRHEDELVCWTVEATHLSTPKTWCQNTDKKLREIIWRFIVRCSCYCFMLSKCPPLTTCLFCFSYYLH